MFLHAELRDKHVAPLMGRKRKQAAKEEMATRQENLEAENERLMRKLEGLDEEIADMRARLAAAEEPWYRSGFDTDLDSSALHWNV